MQNMGQTVANACKPVGHCPQCGYDQRGLPAGSPCPECGRVFWSGLVVGGINKWVDQTVLGLWSIAVLLIIGIGAGLTAVFIAERAPAAAMMMATAAAVYVIAGVAWYILTAAITLRRRLSPAYLNITPHRRQLLARWLVSDAVLLTVLLVLIAILIT